jgi:hypothetical protein
MCIYAAGESVRTVDECPKFRVGEGHEIGAEGEWGARVPGERLTLCAMDP